MMREAYLAMDESLTYQRCGERTEHSMHHIMPLLFFKQKKKEIKHL